MQAHTKGQRPLSSTLKPLRMRWTLPVLAASVLVAFSFASCPGKAQSPAPADVAGCEAPANGVRGIWVSDFTLRGKGLADMAAIADDLVRLNLNTVYLSISGEAGPLWRSPTYEAAGGKPKWDLDLAGMVRVFKERGLRVGAWFESGLGAGIPPLGVIDANPEWLQRKPDGGTVGDSGFVFLSPAHPGAMEYVNGLLRELADPKVGFDEIQLDRFRWNRDLAAGDRVFGFEEASVAAYEAKTGKKPTALDDYVDFTLFRKGLVNDAVAGASRSIRAVNPGMRVTSSPLGYYGFRQQIQFWTDWLAAGSVDGVFAQAYDTDFPRFREHLSYLLGSGRIVDAREKVGLGIWASEKDDAVEVERRICYAYSRGVRDVVLWVYHRYAGRLAVQDEMGTLARPGGPWDPARVR